MPISESNHTFRPFEASQMTNIMKSSSSFKTKSLPIKQEISNLDRQLSKRINNDKGKISKPQIKKKILNNGLVQCFNLNEKEKYRQLIEQNMCKPTSTSFGGTLNTYQALVKVWPTMVKDDLSLNTTSRTTNNIPVSGKISLSYKRKIIATTPLKKLPLQDTNLNNDNGNLDLFIVKEVEAKEVMSRKKEQKQQQQTQENYLQKSSLVSNRILAPSRKLTRQLSEYERSIEERLKVNHARLESILAKCNETKKTYYQVDASIESRYIQIKRQRLEEESKLARQFSDRLQLDNKKLSRILIKDYKPNANEFVELTDEQNKCVTKWLNATPEDEVLVSEFNINITRRDLQTLRGTSWLNDEIINFYMNLIASQAKNMRVYPFTTFFYPKLVRDGFNSLKRWTRRVDIFTYDLLLVPIHLSVHWTLAVIDLRLKEIRYYDSMNGHNNECLKELCMYLKKEHVDKKQCELDSSKWNAFHVRDIPQQMNGSDCGVFACKFADWLCRGKTSFSFNQTHMPYFRRRMVWEIVNKKLL